MQAVTDFCDQPKQASAADLYIAGRLRIARKLARLSQEQLAEGIGITSQQIQKYERGVSRVSASRLYEMALIFGQPVAFFLPPSPRDEPTGAAAVSEVFHLTELMTAPETTYLITAFLRIKDTKTRRHLVALVRSIANDTE